MEPLPASHDEPDREAAATDSAAPRVLGDHPADAPRASPADAAHRAPCPADPRLRPREPQSDHPRHVAANAAVEVTEVAAEVVEVEVEVEVEVVEVEVAVEVGGNGCQSDLKLLPSTSAESRHRRLGSSCRSGRPLGITPRRRSDRPEATSAEELDPSVSS